MSEDWAALAAAWPGLGARQVTVGGARVPFDAAAGAIALLAASRTSAIAPVLRAARHPLAGCDYFRAAAPYLAKARTAPKTGRAGAAGRHVTKAAFLAAIGAELGRAADAELAAALGAFAADERYAAAIARDAVTMRERAHAAGLRSAVRSAAARAVAACAATGARCTLATACGTGACRFATGIYRRLDAPAGPGRTARPPGHERAGEGFDVGAAAAQLGALVPWRDGVPVADCAGGRAA
jgi:hypothetical protein